MPLDHAAKSRAEGEGQVRGELGKAHGLAAPSHWHEVGDDCRSRRWVETHSTAVRQTLPRNWLIRAV